MGAGACWAVLSVGVLIPSCLHVSMEEPRKVFKLYARRAFIMDDCDELIPECFEFGIDFKLSGRRGFIWMTVTS